MRLFPRLRAAALSCVAALLVFNATIPTAAAAVEPLDQVVALVNDDVILQSELEQQIQFSLSQIRQQNLTPPPESALRGQVLEHMILQKIQLQQAVSAGITVSDADMNTVLHKVAAQNHMSISEFADSVRSEGLDFNMVRNEIRDEVILSRLRQKEVDSHVTVTDQDVDLYLASASAHDETEYRLSHILIATPDNASADVRDKAEAKARDIVKRARAGEDFAQLAIANSDGQQALQGGDLGWRKGANLPTLFANVAPHLQVGEVSDVIPGANGFNIIKLTDRRSDDAREMVTETHAEHILLRPNAIRDEDATRAQAADLYKRLKAGEDFGKLAKEFSDDPGSKNTGGDLGWQPPGVFAPEFQSQLDQLKPGEMSEPFHTQFGWHIARVLERRTRDETDQSRHAKAREAVFERREGEDYETWLRRLRAEAYVEIRDPSVDSSNSSNASPDAAPQG